MQVQGKEFKNSEEFNLWWKGPTLLKEIHFLPQEIDTICDEHLTSEIKTLFSQSNVKQ